MNRMSIRDYTLNLTCLSSCSGTLNIIDNEFTVSSELRFDRTSKKGYRLKDLVLICFFYFLFFCSDDCFMCLFSSYYSPVSFVIF